MSGEFFSSGGKPNLCLAFLRLRLTEALVTLPMKISAKRLGFEDSSATGNGSQACVSVSENIVGSVFSFSSTFISSSFSKVDSRVLSFVTSRPNTKG